MYGFRYYFTLLFGVLFTFPSRYLFTIDLLGVFSLTRWCWQIQREFHRLPPTQDPSTSASLTCTGLSPCIAKFPNLFQFAKLQMLRSYNPGIAVTIPVWANPRSLATTYGITIVFSSSGYLDVSVPRVSLLADNRSSTCWVVPFGNLRINSYLPITAAYRSLSRPSSPLRV